MRRLAASIAVGFVLVTCTSCQTADLDQNGDGQVTTQELWTAVFNSVCGNQSQEQPADQTPTDQTPTTATPAESTDIAGAAATAAS